MAYTTYPNGVEKTLCFVEKGNLVGEEVFAENPVRIVSVNAVTNVNIYCIDKNSLLKICTDNKTCIEALFKFYMKKITSLSNFIFTAQFLNNDQKIAYYLYTNYKKENDYIYYTHEQISAITGMSRVSTTKILNKFKDSGLIDLSYKYIRVLNLRGLEEIFQGMDFF
jgi:CRP-like cAMP-binding protein